MYYSTPWMNPFICKNKWFLKIIFVYDFNGEAYYRFAEALKVSIWGISQQSPVFHLGWHSDRLKRGWGRMRKTIGGKGAARGQSSFTNPCHRAVKSWQAISPHFLFISFKFFKCIWEWQGSLFWDSLCYTSILIMLKIGIWLICIKLCNMLRKKCFAIQITDNVYSKKSKQNAKLFGGNLKLCAIEKEWSNKIHHKITNHEYN